MIEAALEWWSDRLQGRLIPIDGKPYMERYFLGTYFRRTVYLQCILMGDTDRGLHNHPWAPAWSILLHGHYKELRLNRAIDPATRSGDYLHFIKPIHIVLRTVRFFNRLGRGVYHRIVMDESTSERVWTLFIRGETTGEGWGFVYAGVGVKPREGYKMLRYRQYNPATDDTPGERDLMPGWKVKMHRMAAV